MGQAPHKHSGCPVPIWQTSRISGNLSDNDVAWSPVGQDPFTVCTDGGAKLLDTRPPRWFIHTHLRTEFVVFSYWVSLQDLWHPQSGAGAQLNCTLIEQQTSRRLPGTCLKRLMAQIPEALPRRHFSWRAPPIDWIPRDSNVGSNCSALLCLAWKQEHTHKQSCSTTVYLHCLSRFFMS